MEKTENFRMRKYFEKMETNTHVYTQRPRAA